MDTSIIMLFDGLLLNKHTSYAYVANAKSSQNLLALDPTLICPLRQNKGFSRNDSQVAAFFKDKKFLAPNIELIRPGTFTNHSLRSNQKTPRDAINFFLCRKEPIGKQTEGKSFFSGGRKWTNTAKVSIVGRFRI